MKLNTSEIKATARGCLAGRYATIVIAYMLARFLTNLPTLLISNMSVSNSTIRDLIDISVGLIIAFQKYNIFKGIKGSQFVGLENFKFVFGMRDFGIALRNTLWLNLLDLIFGFPMPIILAILLNEMRMKQCVSSLNKVVRHILFILQ